MEHILPNYPLLPGTRCSDRHIPGKFNILAHRLSRLDRPIETDWALDQSIANSIFQRLNYPNVDLFAKRFNHKLSLYVSPVPDSHALAIDAFSMNWDLLHAYAFPPFIPAVLAKIHQSQCRIVLVTPLWPQRPWFSAVLQCQRNVFRFFQNFDTSKRKISSSKSPTSRPSRLGVIKQSIRDKNFSQNVADLVS